MSLDDYLSAPDAHLDPVVAAEYDNVHDPHFHDQAINSAVSFLAELAQDGHAVEFAVGTGRLAIPLAQALSLIHI